MQYIPTKYHGAFDYVIAVLLVLGAYPLGYAGGEAQTWVAVVAGLGVACYSLLTDYEWGLARRLPVPVHTALDLVTGLVLAGSPWVLGFESQVWAPHFVAGALLMAASLTTQPRAYGLEHPAFLRVHEVGR